MKLTPLYLLISASLSAASFTVSLTTDATTAQNGNAVAVFDSSNQAIAVGGAFISIGSFSSTPTFDSTLTATSLASSFNIYGSSVTLNGTDFGGGFIMDSTFATSASGVTIAGSSFENEDLVILLTDSATIGSATQALVIDSGIDFLSSNDTTPGSVDVSTLIGSAPLFGSNSVTTGIANISNGGPVNTATSFGLSNLATVAVPEPTTLTLAGLGSLALITRRRR